MQEKTKLLMGTILMGCTALSGTWALASSSEIVLDEVIVTAERRQASSQDVPITVQVYSGEDLEKNGIVSLMDLQNISPSLVIIDSTAFVTPFIRGTGSSVLGNGIYSSVATYIDGVYVARQTSAAFELQNVDSIQVLSGPQGALYGRNATAGTIVITSKTAMPGDETEARFSATYGTYNTRTVKARVSGSVSKQLAVSLNGAIHKRDGFIKNLNPVGYGQHQEDVDDRDSFSFGGAISFVPNDRFQAILRGSYFESHDRASCCYQAIGQSVTPGLFPGLNSNQTALAGIATQLLGSPALGFQVGASAAFSNVIGEIYDPHQNGNDAGIFDINIPIGSGFHISQRSISLNMDYDFDGFIAKSITSFGSSEYNGTTSVGAEAPGLGFSPVSGVTVPLTGSVGFTGSFPSDTFSQEFQISSANDSKVIWTAGLYYFSEDGTTDLTGDFFGASLWSARNDYKVESYAGYAQVTVPLTDEWSATGGLRYTTEKFSIVDRFDPTNPASFPGIPNLGSLSRKDDNLTYLARVQYDAGDWLVYGGVSTGFKSGALNANNPIAGAAEPEEIRSIEFGLKSDLFDNVRLNVAGYFYDYKNIHQNVIDSGSGATFLLNGGNAKITGIDAELIVMPTDSLTLKGAVTFLDTDVKSDAILSPTSVLPTAGKNLPGAPGASFNFNANWVVPIVTTGELVVNVNYSHNSGYFFDPENRVGTGGVTAKGYGLVNFNLSYVTPNDRWEVSVWGNNIFNERYFRTGVVALGYSLLGIAANPAHFGVTVSFKY